MHFFTFKTVLGQNVNSMLKYIKIFKGTPTCFNLNRSKHVGIPLNIFMYFNIEIDIFD